MKKKLIYAASAALVVVIAIIALVSIFVKQYKKSHAPSEVVKDLTEYYGIAADEAMIIIDEKVYDKRGLWKNGTAYIDLDTVTEMYIHRFFWVAEENLMLYTTPDKIYHFVPGQKEYTLNDETVSDAYPVVELKGSEPYVSVNFLENCGITYRVYDEPHRVMITYSDETFLVAPVVKETQIRVSQSIKADLLTTVHEGDIVRFIDGGGIREEGFIKVMSRDGVRGYILESALGESSYTDPVFTEFAWPEYTHMVYSDKVYLGWMLLYNKDNVGYLKEAIARAPEMNVVSPTWFFMEDIEGSLKSYANKDFVQYAHDNGVKVWATYKNDTIDGYFECTEDSHLVLSSTERRSALIDSIMSSAKEYGLDGINIDFEMLKLDSGIYFVQFLRELSVKCREKGLILSVDNYVPENYNAYYNLKEQSAVVDYIVIMGYDEHYAGSAEAGSVSSLEWFSGAAAGTAEKCDMTRVIMGVPFYTRLWKIKDGGVYVEETPSMAAAEKKVKSVGAKKEWKKAAGQYYAEWKSGGATYKIWLEDEESLTAKVLAAREYDVAGIAAWKCGDEKNGIWAVLKDALEGELPEEEDSEGDGE